MGIYLVKHGPLNVKFCEEFDVVSHALNKRRSLNRLYYKKILGPR
jgi:hypothetical protein